MLECREANVMMESSWQPTAIPAEGGMYYRCETMLYSGMFDGDISIVPIMHHYYIVKHTPKGVWIGLSLGIRQKLILHASRKKYAWPTKELAWESFVKRKQRQAEILRRQLAVAEKSLLFCAEDFAAGSRITLWLDEYRQPYLQARQKTRLDPLTGLTEVV